MDSTTLRLKIGQKIKQLRKSKGHSQEFLSELLRCSKERISRLERGKVSLREDILLNIANFYKEDVSYFYSFQEIQEEKEQIITEINLKLQNYSIEKLVKINEMLKISE